MTETLLGLVPQYGVALMFVATFLSCLALPVPSSLIMLTGGALAASGDLDLTNVALAAWLGALLGDQAGFAIGRWGERHVTALIARHPKRAALVEKARAFSRRWGGPGVYLSRWLVSPLGPYVNFLVGASDMRWRRFALWDSLGEATWVALYVGLGFAFADQITALADILGNLSGALAAGLVTVLIGRTLFKHRREPHV